MAISRKDQSKLHCQVRTSRRVGLLVEAIYGKLCLVLASKAKRASGLIMLCLELSSRSLRWVKQEAGSRAASVRHQPEAKEAKRSKTEQSRCSAR